MTKRKPARVCLFTGISGVLGTDFHPRYADRYEIVGVHNTAEPKGPTVGLEATQRPDGAIFGLQADLLAPGAVEALVSAVLERFESVDLLVNAAVFRRFGRISAKPFTNSLSRQFRMNVCVPMEVAGALARQAWIATPEENRKRKRNIVNLSSTAGLVVYPGHGQSGYAASKAALDAATLHMASEFANFGVRANAIAPNTFPRFVPTAAVSDAIGLYDRSRRTGEILVMEADGDFLLPDR